MLDKLDQSQIDLLDKKREEWINFAFNCGDELDIEAFKFGITWVYEKINLKDPIKVYVDSPLGLQYACQILKKIDFNKIKSDQVYDQVNDQVYNQVYDQVYSQVYDQVNDQVNNQVNDQVNNQVYSQVNDQVYDQVYSQVYDQVNDQVRDQVYNQVSDQVYNQVRDQVSNQVSDQVNNQVRDEYESFSWVGVGWDAGWNSFYDYFDNIGIKITDDFKKYRDFVKSGVYDTILFNNFAIGCRRPNFIGRDVQNRMHSDIRSAISWRDGYELYYLAGVNFKKELWEKVVSGKMTFKEILDIENSEQRLQAMRYNPDALLKTGATLIHRTPRDNELYLIEKQEINKIYNESKVWFLRFKDPSKTDPNNWFIEEVDPKVAEITPNADVVQAYHCGLSYSQYQTLKLES